MVPDGDGVCVRGSHTQPLLDQERYLWKSSQGLLELSSGERPEVYSARGPSTARTLLLHVPSPATAQGKEIETPTAQR